VRKRVSQDWTIYKKFAAKRWSRGMLKPPSLEKMRLLSPRVPAMKKTLVPPHGSSQQERSPKYSVTSMQHEEALAQLGQQINQIILSSSKPETLLQQIAQLLGETFQVDCCLVTITPENQEQTLIGCWYANPATTVPSPKLMQPLEQRSGIMPAAANLLVIDEINAVEHSSWAAWQNLLPLAQAILQLPIWFQGKLNGVVSLIHFQPYHWSESETKLAKALASSVAIAFSHIVQTQLLASLQQQVQRSAQSKSLLNQLTMASRSSLELNQILQMAIGGISKALEVTRGLILLLKYADPLFKTRAREKIPKAKATVISEWSKSDDSGVSESQIGSLLNQSFWISECLLCQQALTNSPNPIIINDRYDLPPINPETEIATLFNLAHLPSLLILPLESQGTVLGFLVLQHSSIRRWHPEELSLVELVSAQISTTIIQNQTLRQVQSLVEERTTQLQRSLDVQGKLYEKTRQQIDQLRQLNLLKDEFLSTMSHELRTPLTSMSLAIRMLRQTGITPERQVKYLDILQQQCTQEINLINDLLKLQQLESNQATLKLETIDIKPKLHELAESFMRSWADKGLDISLDLPKTSLLVQTDVESFERILQELLTNAGKYSDPDTTVVLKVAHQVDQIVLTLTNIGSSISPEDMKHIFDKFRRGQGITQQAIQGTGLGLALVKCLVQHLNGNINATSSAIRDTSAYETCFTLTLPQLFAPR
jgi:signal transduction histidine kinase